MTGGRAEQADRRAGPSLRAQTALLLAWLALAAVYAPTFKHLLSVWFGNVVFHHQPAVAALALFLLWRRTGAGGTGPATVERAPWPVIVLAAFLSWGWFVARLADLAIGMHLAAILLMGLAAVALAGVQALPRLAFALGYLLLAVPAGLVLVPLLQQATASIALALLKLAAVPFWNDGFTVDILTPSGLARFSIEAACSGVRYLFASLAVGVLFAWVAARGARRLGIVAIFTATPIIANALRTTGILLLASAYGLRAAQAVDHRLYGLIFFLMTLLLSFAAAWPLTDRRPARRIRDAARAKPEARASWRALLAFLAAAALGPLLASLWRLLA